MVHWAKVVAILEMPNPTNVHILRSFIELCNYYMIYVQDFSTIAHPLYALLKKDVAWTWNEEVQEAFNTLKEKLLEFPILRRFDFSKVFILHTNWSALGIGVILSQLESSGSFQHTQGKAFKFPILRRLNFNKVFILHTD